MNEWVLYPSRCIICHLGRLAYGQRNIVLSFSKMASRIHYKHTTLNEHMRFVKIHGMLQRHVTSTSKMCHN